VAVLERKLAANREQRAGLGLFELAAEDRFRRLRGHAEGPGVLDPPDHPAQIVERAGAKGRVSR
jgi:hypothetical protein